MSEDKAYIYELIDPRTGEPRYVGKANNLRKRMKDHKYLAKSEARPIYDWMRKLKRLGLEPMMQVIEECDGAVWAEREMFWIARYRELGYRLLNCNDGGMGGNGYSHSLETRHKLSEASRGRTHTEETRRKLSEAARNLSPETRLKRSEAARNLSPETRLKRSEASRGRTHTEETRRKISEARKGKKGAPHTLEARRKISEAQKKKIAQYALNGQFIRYWDSALDAGKCTTAHNTAIIACCKHRRKRKSAGGYIWRYADDPLNADEILIGTPDHQLSLFDDDPTGDDE